MRFKVKGSKLSALKKRSLKQERRIDKMIRKADALTKKAEILDHRAYEATKKYEKEIAKWHT